MTSLLMGGLATAGACKSKTEDAAKAQETANKKTNEAVEAQKEADAKAIAAKRETEEKLLKDRTDARDKIQKDLADIDRKAADLKVKLTEAKGDIRKNADAAATEVQTRHSKIDASMAKMSNAAGDAWDAAKLEVEADLAAFKESVENFEKSLKK